MFDDQLPVGGKWENVDFIPTHSDHAVPIPVPVPVKLD